MKKIAYEIVAMEVERIFTSIVSVKDFSTISRYYNEYLNYLDACGWTEKEFETKALNIIDSDWEDKTLN